MTPVRGNVADGGAIVTHNELIIVANLSSPC